ncbi:MAG: hypothetical protein PHD53_00180 [Methylococcales bacterium]|nr:hypothetical protein [Methylococcales bacterium]
MTEIDLGLLRFAFKGIFDAAVTYEYNNIVRYGGGTYAYISQVKTAGFVPTNTLYWQKIIEGYNYRGDWAATTAYMTSDVVTDGISTFVALSDHISSATLAADGIYPASGAKWKYLAKGAAGVPAFTMADKDKSLFNDGTGLYWGISSYTSQYNDKAAVNNVIVNNAIVPCTTFSSQKVYAGNVIYMRVMQLADAGKFVVGAVPADGIGNMEACLTPFSVDQTTGAITQAAPARQFTQAVNTPATTCEWAAVGNHVYFRGSIPNPSAGTVPDEYAFAASVTNNTVSGFSGVLTGNYNVVSNYDPLVILSGTTSHNRFASYGITVGVYLHKKLQYTGSVLSLADEAVPSPVSNTSTNFVMPCIPSFANRGIGAGGLIGYLTATSPRLVTQNASLDRVAEYDSLALFGFGMDWNATDAGFGFQLSNGEKVYFGAYGNYIKESTLNVLSSLGRPNLDLYQILGNSRYCNRELIIPLPTANTWAAFASDGSLISFKIDPATYVVTMLKSVGVKALIPDTNNAMVAITGSSNQFMVLANWVTRGSYAKVSVINNPFI